MTDPTDLRVVRAFSTELDATDGRNIVGRCVPFDEPALVADGAGIPYREVWRSGSFRRIVRAPHRVLLTYEHREGLGDTIGPAAELDERGDGLWAVFRALPGVLGDQALELIRAGAVTGLSVQALVSVRHSRTLDDGTVERSLAKSLEHVALTREAAFAGAAVTAIRTAPDLDDDELATPRIDEVRAWRDAARVHSRATS